MQDIDVVILTGGKGTRLRSVVNDRPKTMSDVNGVPFLDIIIQYLNNYGLNRFVLCTGYMSEYIEKYYSKKNNDYNVIISEEKVPLGTAGAIKNSESIVFNDPFFVLNGDSFCEIDYRDLLQFHITNNALITVVVSLVESGKDYSKIVMNDNHRILEFSNNKGYQNEVYVNAGIYCIDKSFFSMVPPFVFFSLEKDFIPNHIENRIYAYITNKSFIDIGTPVRYQLTKKKDLFSHV